MRTHKFENLNCKILLVMKISLRSVLPSDGFHPRRTFYTNTSSLWSNSLSQKHSSFSLFGTDNVSASKSSGPDKE